MEMTQQLVNNQIEATQKSLFFKSSDLINCGNTAITNKIRNQPLQAESLKALEQLALNILDPVVEHFGPITLTYGFCSPELARVIKKNENPHIAPNLDQHACHELNSKGNLICNRLGAAVDFRVDAMPDRIDEVALWMADNLKFDRLYYYGKSRPLHISYGPEMNQFVQLMNTNEKTGRRTPGKKASNNEVVKLLSQLNY